MSARKKAPVNLLMCPFELYMFIGVSMQLRVVFKYDVLVLIPYCWSVALEKKKKKKKKTIGDRENGTVVAHVVAHIDLEPFAQEPNALPVAYCDSLASL